MPRSIAVGSIFLLLVGGCATPLTPRESGTLAGASIGAATGAILGGIGGSAGKGAAIGAVVGAMAGALTGNAIQNEQAARAYPP
ncbi:MAG: glycine zipper domain-containing protein, partial [Candidatus Methylomirabilaceae bacterium]